MELSEYTNPLPPLQIDSCGYLFFSDKEHPLAYKSNYKVFFHRYVASLKLRRWIRSDEHVHHKDHNRKNNRSSNLQILNSSEHAQLHGQESLKERECKICGKTFKKKNRNLSKHYCSKECSSTFRKFKIDWPSAEEIAKLVWEIPTQKLAQQLGVSDVAIAKFCRKHKINKPSRGYWAKQQSINFPQS
jgi:hypothetical protein